MKHNCITDLRTCKWSTPPGYINHGVLDKIHNDYGYWHDGGYFFYVKDYQGNVRVVLDQNNQPVELNSYYPYGSLMAATTAEGVQSRKYGAKELDRENGLDWYDFHARQMDPMVPHFTSPDKKAEDYYSISPYAYCAGNPVKFLDLDGNELVINGSEALKKSYLDMLYCSTGNRYVINDDNKLNLIGMDSDFKGSTSQTLIDLIDAAINSESVFSFSLTGESGDDKTVFIDSYETKQLDIADLKQIGGTSTALQGALIGHQMNEIMVGGIYKEAHNQSLKKEGVIFGELIGDTSISARTDDVRMPNAPFDNVFRYNNHAFLLQSGSSYIEKPVGKIGKIIILESNGELKKVKKL